MLLALLVVAVTPRLIVCVRRRVSSEPGSNFASAEREEGGEEGGEEEEDEEDEVKEEREGDEDEDDEYDDDEPRSPRLRSHTAVAPPSPVRRRRRSTGSRSRSRTRSARSIPRARSAPRNGLTTSPRPTKGGCIPPSPPASPGWSETGGGDPEELNHTGITTPCAGGRGSTSPAAGSSTAGLAAGGNDTPEQRERREQPPPAAAPDGTRTRGSDGVSEDFPAAARAGQDNKLNHLRTARFAEEREVSSARSVVSRDNPSIFCVNRKASFPLVSDYPTIACGGHLKTFCFRN